MASLPPSFAASRDPLAMLHPGAPAGGCGPGNSRLPGPLCGHAPVQHAALVDAPTRHAEWYDALLGGAFPKRVMAVYDAIVGARRLLPRALIDATGMELHEILAGVLPSLLVMVAVLAVSTTVGAAAGAAIGALAFGVGAVPGAAAGAGVGLEVGTALLEYLGLAFLVVYIGRSLLAGTRLAAVAVERAWHSVDQSPHLRDVSMITASRELASAVALVFRGVLQGLVAFLLAKGTAAAAGRVPELVANLRKSRLGATFAGWVERNWVALIENPKLRKASAAEPAPRSAGRDAATPSATRDAAATAEDAGAGKAKAETPAARRATARSFYESAGWSDRRIDNHLAGIDFTKPVDVITLPKDQVVVQHLVPGSDVGNYFAPVGTPASALGINPAGRVPTLFSTTADVPVLRSTAAQIVDTWTVPGTPFPAEGGGTQYFTPDPSLFHRGP